MGRRQPTTHVSAARDFGQRVRQVVTTLLAGGLPDVRLVADMLSTTSRTLQRRLRSAGLTYAGLVQRARCTVAQQMLRDPHRTIADVARTLGYSDPAHFTRAFRRWTGHTPRDYRRRRGDAHESAMTSGRRREPPRQ